MRRLTTAIATSILALTLAACGSNDEPADPTKLDDAGSLACDDFATGYKAAQTRQARIDLANKVNKWAQTSATHGIADNATALANSSAGSAGAWQIGADAFAKACLDAGWKA
ncbi:hypothetical protein [Streptomyces sp. NPDC056069]|uniref:hypothetical protein n=1 Tax=Streptomyces sp. NPDC056069 TaxID=3345702 RepID=UPI0035E32078